MNVKDKKALIITSGVFLSVIAFIMFFTFQKRDEMISNTGRYNGGEMPLGDCVSGISDSCPSGAYDCTTITSASTCMDAGYDNPCYMVTCPSTTYECRSNYDCGPGYVCSDDDECVPIASDGPINNNCPSNCSQCSNATTCTECMIGFKNVNGKCEEITDCTSNCAKCASPNRCSECQTGYENVNGFCEEITDCTSNCAKCDSANKCSECQTGYHLTSTGSCEQNRTIMNCAVYASDGEHCSVCEENYELAGYGYSCVYAGTSPGDKNCDVPNCSSCEAGKSYICSTCENGYHLTSTGSCEQDPSHLILHCSVYASDGEHCSVCDDNYKLAGYGYNCVYNGSSPGGKNCDVPNCSSCEAGKSYICSKCENGYHLTTNGSCVKTNDDNICCFISYENGSANYVNTTKNNCSGDIVSLNECANVRSTASSCNVSVTTSSLVTSKELDNEDNSYYTVQVCATGLGCADQTIDHTGTTNYNRLSENSHHVPDTASYKYCYEYRVYPNDPCNVSIGQAKYDNSKITGTNSDTTHEVTIKYDWRSTDVECVKNPTYNSFEKADAAGADVYYSDRDALGCYKKEWTRYDACGLGGEPVVEQPQNNACYKKNGNYYVGNYSSNSSYTFVSNDTTKCNKIVIGKVDESGKNIPGATFKITKPDGSTISQSMGTYTMEKLEKGTYKISETVAPNNYQLDTTTVTFVVDATGKITVSNSSNVYTRSTSATFNAFVNIKDLTKTEQREYCYIKRGTGGVANTYCHGTAAKCSGYTEVITSTSCDETPACYLINGEYKIGKFSGQGTKYGTKCPSPACYYNSKDGYHWTDKPESDDIKVTSIVDKDDCNEDNTKFCWVNKTTNDYKWAKEAPGSGYEKETSITNAIACAPAEAPACYEETKTGIYKWGLYEKVVGYDKVPNVTKEADCEIPACYTNISTGKYAWGKYENNSSYKLMPGITETNCKEVKVPPTALNVTKLIYVIMSIFAVIGIGFITYSKKMKKYN